VLLPRLPSLLANILVGVLVALRAAHGRQAPLRPLFCLQRTCHSWYVAPPGYIRTSPNWLNVYATRPTFSPRTRLC